MRPHLTQLRTQIYDVQARGNGYAVTCAGRVEILDADRESIAVLEGGEGSRLTQLAADRFLLHGQRLSRLFEGALGGAFTQVDLGEGHVDSVAVTASGFHAFHSRGVLVDHAGTRTQVAPPQRWEHGGCAWRGGSVIAGSGGIAILAADGKVVATADMQLAGSPVALADVVAVPGHGGIVCFDGTARLVASIPRSPSRGGIVGFGDGLLVRITDGEGTETELSYWGPRGVARWRRTFEGHWKAPQIVGDRIILASYARDVLVLDAAGNQLARIETAGVAHAICAFGDGLAICVRDARDVIWWRPTADATALSHDDDPSGAWSGPAGLVTAEGSALFLWRTDVDGPAWEPIETALPMDTPLVIGGGIVTLFARGRLALRGRLPNGKTCRIAATAVARPVVSRDEAEGLVAKLIARSFEGPLPAIPEDTLVYQVAAKLAQLPLAETVDLYGRSLFTPSSLPAEVKRRASWGHAAFFQELAFALGTPARSLLAAIRVRKRTLAPPRPVPEGYDYLGAFTSTGDLEVSDPCYRGKKPTAFPLTVKVAGLDGTWHAFANTTRGALDDEGNGELVVIHDDGFGIHAIDPAGSIGVDSGTVGVFDKQCPIRNDDNAFLEGTWAALSVAVWSRGDGFYPVFTGKHKGKVAKIRVQFSGGEPEKDRSIVRSTAPAKPYKASEKFAVGDVIEHVKFGAGEVIRVGGDGKIDVCFADSTRTLIHARK